jgi:hypothetical protein
MMHAFAAVFAWSAAREGKHVVFGPRFAVYPAVVQAAGGGPGLDVDLAIVEDKSAIDRLCRFALARYRLWSQATPARLRVTADGQDVEVGPDGTFAVGSARDVVVHAGSASTAVGEGMPFLDPRLA